MPLIFFFSSSFRFGYLPQIHARTNVLLAFVSVSYILYALLFFCPLHFSLIFVFLMLFSLFTFFFLFFLLRHSPLTTSRNLISYINVYAFFFFFLLFLDVSVICYLFRDSDALDSPVRVFVYDSIRN